MMASVDRLSGRTKVGYGIGGWVLLARRIGRRRAAFIGVFLLGAGTTVVYPLLPAGALIGSILVGSVFLFDATVADVVDWDEAIGGVHREGIFFGVWRMVSKMARALGLAITGWMLDATGFTAGAASQTAGTRQGLGLASGPGVGVLFMIAALIWLCVPLNQRYQARIRRVLIWRRARI